VYDFSAFVNVRYRLTVVYLQPIFPSNSHTTIPHKTKQPPKPRDLAIALLILEGDKYTRILLADYISCFQQGENNVRDALETNHTITCWVQQAVLRCDEVEARSRLVEFFVYTAEVTGHLDVFISPRLIPIFAGIS
jgi:hypothetical protein